MNLLKKEQKLQQIVRLIGSDTLPDSEKLILVVAEMIKNGFLQQNAFDKVDVFSVPKKELEILRLMMKFYKLGRELVKSGVPFMKIAESPVKTDIIKIKNTVPNDDLQGIRVIEAKMETDFENLGKIYKKGGEA